MQNNPIRYTDPTGHVFEEDTGSGGPCDTTDCYVIIENLTKARSAKDEILEENSWDFIPMVSDARHIIRGVQIANIASQQPEFMDQQHAIQHWYDNCYGLCHYSDYIEGASGPIGGPMPSVPLVDLYSEGMGEAANGVVNIGLTVSIAKAAPVQTFARGGPEWHVGLETVENMNIVHIGNHSQFGTHIAFGAVRPFAANLHVYIQKAFPFFRIWKP